MYSLFIEEQCQFVHSKTDQGKMKNIFICFVIFVGCKVAKPLTMPNDPCQIYLNALKESCVRDSLGLFKFTGQGLDKSKENCLIGLNRSQLKSVFGVPDFEDNNMLVYYLSKECKNDLPNMKKIGCVKFHLIMDVTSDTLFMIPIIGKEGGVKH
jgi:hypothetical protein